MSSSIQKETDENEDYYELLQITPEASLKEISRAYRLLSLRYHPDKAGADDLDAQDMFLRLTKAYDVLKDEDLRKDYDTKYAAQLAQKRRMQEMEEKRKKSKMDLDERERQHRLSSQSLYDPSSIQLRHRIDQLRAEGLRKVKQYKEEIKQSFSHNIQESLAFKSSLDKPTGLEATLKLKWDPTKQFIQEMDIQQLISPIGMVQQILVSANNKGTAVVSFESILAAYRALISESFKERQIRCDWVSGKQPACLPKLLSMTEAMNSFSFASTSIDPVEQKMPFEDYEKIVLDRMRQYRKTRLSS